MKIAYIGFDPGDDGFITAKVEGEEHKFYSMPTEPEETGKILVQSIL